MKRVVQYLMEPGDESLVRSWSGIALGACIVGLPVLSGVMDLRTCLIASLAGAIPALLFWRQIGEPSNRPISIMAFFILVLGLLGIARIFDGLASFTYLGAWMIVLSVMRLATGWRDPFGRPRSPNGVPIPRVDHSFGWPSSCRCWPSSASASW